MLRSLVTILFLLLSGSLYAQEGVAVISLHGKWGSPPGPLAAQLARSGFKVVSLEMPWSGKRQYDVTYAQALAEITKSVAELKQQGTRKIVLAGHSFGANVALAYAKAYGDIDALLLYAPGHVPEIWFPKGKGSSSVEKAQNAVKAGKTEELIEFTDFNAGNKTQNFKRRADVYLSYFDPDGLGNMPLSASQLKRNVPVLLVMSSEDGRGKSYIWDRLSPNPQSRYIETNASHFNTPESVVPQTLEFLKNF